MNLDKTCAQPWTDLFLKTSGLKRAADVMNLNLFFFFKRVLYVGEAT